MNGLGYWVGALGSDPIDAGILCRGPWLLHILLGVDDWIGESGSVTFDETVYLDILLFIF